MYKGLKWSFSGTKIVVLSKCLAFQLLGFCLFCNEHHCLAFCLAVLCTSTVVPLATLLLPIIMYVSNEWNQRNEANSTLACLFLNSWPWMDASFIRWFHLIHGPHLHILNLSPHQPAPLFLFSCVSHSLGGYIPSSIHNQICTRCKTQVLSLDP